jgi:ABC-type nitrate/sulfonate/bicarbonate transport system permease component
MKLPRHLTMSPLARAAISIGALLVTWEGLSRAEIVHISLFPPPSRVMLALIEMARSGELARDVWVSTRRAFLGLFLGTAVGVVGGILTGRVPIIDAYLSPGIQLLRPLPPVSIIPLIITWLGITEFSKVFSISFAVFFPVWINAHLGTRSVPRTFLWTAGSLRLGRFRTLGRIVCPAAMPFIVAGFRSGIAVAFVMVFVSELAGASSGIGYQIQLSQLAYRVDRMMASLAVLGAMGALTDYALTRVVWLTFPWLKLTTNN